MGRIRAIKPEEVILTKHLLHLAGEEVSKFEISDEVDAYENDVMGSINYSLSEEFPYDGDIIRVEYTDSDGVGMLISLTKNTNGELLDLDFWKVDLAKLLRYPRPEDVKINTSGMI